AHIDLQIFFLKKKLNETMSFISLGCKIDDTWTFEGMHYDLTTTTTSLYIVNNENFMKHLFYLSFHVAVSCEKKVNCKIDATWTFEGMHYDLTTTTTSLYIVNNENFMGRLVLKKKFKKKTLDFEKPIFTIFFIIDDNYCH
ncbi:hypothetical protein ACJX0J_011187, partial [Zea mays]